MENKNVYRRLIIFSAVFVLAVIVVSMFLLGISLPFTVGAFTGCLLMVYKSAFWWKLPVMMAGSAKRPLWALLLNVGVQLMTGIALFVAALLNTRFFYGIAAGMLAGIAGTVIGTLRSRVWKE